MSKLNIFDSGYAEIKKASEPLYAFPKSFTENIEVTKISEKGIFEIGPGRYSKTYKFSDINYETSSEDEQIAIFDCYARILNSIDVSYKISVINQYREEEEFRKNMLYQYKDDGYDYLREAFNEDIEKKLYEGKQGIEQKMYLTVSIERNNFEEAKAYFASIEVNLRKDFNNMDSDIEALDANERLKLLHDMYCFGSSQKFDGDFEDYRKNYKDFRNDLQEGFIQFDKRGYNFKINEKVAQVIYIKDYPNFLTDRLIKKISDLTLPMILSVDYQPVPREIAIKYVNNKLMGVEKDIQKQQQKRNKHNDFSSDISLKKRNEKKDVEEIANDMRENDQNMFLVAFSICIFADDLEELKERINSVKRVCSTESIKIDTYYLKQREAFNTVLPLGVRQITNTRILLTRCAAALMPFSTAELLTMSQDRIMYGINQVSKNPVIGDRKTLTNGNGMIFGTSGSGKSVATKKEQMGSFLNTEDDIIVIDPTGEYKDICELLNGTVISINTHTKNFMNPLDVRLEDLDVNDTKGLISNKCEFMLSLCERCLNQDISPRTKSIIDRCTREMYLNNIDRQKLLEDFYNILLEQEEPEAKNLALALEMFVKGSLNIFNHYTNIDIDNRFILYEINDMGEELGKIAQLNMLENIRQRIIRNSKIGRATRLYVDEFHNFITSEYTTAYFLKLMKEVRKLQGLVTCITQNVADVLQSYAPRAMFNNCEFLILLRQKPQDIEDLVGMVDGMSEAQIKYILRAMPGTGLIKHGNTLVAYDDVIKKDNLLYKIFNTNAHEIAAEMAAANKEE